MNISKWLIVILALALCLSASGCTEKTKIVYVNESGQEIPAPDPTETTEATCDSSEENVASQGTIVSQSVDLAIYRNITHNFQKENYVITGDKHDGFRLPDTNANMDGNQIEIWLRFNQETTIDSFKWQLNKNDGSEVPENYRGLDNPVVFKKGEVIKVVTTPTTAAKAGSTFLLSGYNKDKEIFVVESGIHEGNEIAIEEVFNPIKWKQT